MKRLFGTDGIRAVAGEYPLDPPTVAAVGAALVRHLLAGGPVSGGSVPGQRVPDGTASRGSLSEHPVPGDRPMHGSSSPHPATGDVSALPVSGGLVSGSSVSGGTVSRYRNAGAAQHTRDATIPRVLVGRDTRESGPWMQEAIIAGVRRAGGEADAIGVITTPGLAVLTGRGGYRAGIMLSASHNPFRDNGIKIFAPGQMKLSDEFERVLEDDILRETSEITARAARASYDPPELRQTERERPKTGTLPPPSGEERAAAGRLLALYEQFLVESIAPGTRLAGLRVVLDCANGAASAIAPALFTSLGADVVATHVSPDGRNINEKCGALHAEGLGRAVVEAKADLGLAFDGDADRCLLADRTGRVLDGDFILYVEGTRLHRLGALPQAAVVATVMSNLWLEKKLAEAGIRLHRAPVGDKYVLERMLAEGIVLGGEQSGHVIFLDRCRAGDGILTGLRISEVVVHDGLDLARMADGIERFPQVLLNVPVSSKPPLDAHPEIGPVIREVESSLAGSGRALVRYSGTEPLARVMIEGSDQGAIEKAAAKIVDAIKRHLGP